MIFRKKSPQTGYVLQFSKVLSLNGEQYSVTCNLPIGAEEDEFEKEWKKLLSFPQKRMVELNKEMLDNQKRQEEAREALKKCQAGKR